MAIKIEDLQLPEVHWVLADLIGIVAGCAMRQAGTSDPSSFFIGGPVNR